MGFSSFAASLRKLGRRTAHKDPVGIEGHAASFDQHLLAGPATRGLITGLFASLLLAIVGAGGLLAIGEPLLAIFSASFFLCAAIGWGFVLYRRLDVMKRVG
ncbi:hypothetical protein ACFSM5_00375 [Lacibacterium aquatile]|uniref:Uncharacterized protein n=1 Tax=Lacibacterium aquatile TaxID=1168082 RepID=A0ABW5DJP7_9PROT